MKLTDLQGAIRKKKSRNYDVTDTVTEDVVMRVSEYSNIVADWLAENAFSRRPTKNNHMYAMENYSLSDTTEEKIIGDIEHLIASLKLPTTKTNVDTVKEIIGNTLLTAMGKTAGEIWSDRASTGITTNVANSNVVNMGMESFIPSSIMRHFVSYDQLSRESFGVDTDKALPDLRSSIVVGVMKFFNSVTGKVFNKKVVNDPMIYINTDSVMIYKTDSTDPEIPMVELNRDPEVVSAELTRIIAREANDATNVVLVEDGVVAINQEANLMKLSLDATKPAFQAANKTDLISDDVRLESVLVTFDNAAGAPEVFEFKVPTALSRLTYATQGASTKRVANITFDAYIKNDSKTRAGVDTALFANIHNDDVVVVNITVNPVIDLKYCNYICTGAITVKAQNAKSATTTVNTATTTALTAVTVRTLTATVPDARFSEENLRKTNIGAEVVTTTYSYNIPQGRNYFVDYSFTQEVDTDRSTSMLLNLINTGIDYRTLKLIESELGVIKDRWTNYVPNGLTIFQPGEGYACSNRIKPVAFTGTFDCGEYDSMKELEKMADIHTAARIFFNGIVTKIDADSYISTQLAGGQCVYRVIADPRFLGNILGIGHMHDRLRASAPAQPAPGTVNAVVMLDSGVTLEIVTVPFQSMVNKVFGVLYLDSAPESTLNFAINADMGSLVAHYQTDYANSGGLRNRLFTNVRELPIVTNPTGFAVGITGMPAELHLSE